MTGKRAMPRPKESKRDVATVKLHAFDALMVGDGFPCYCRTCVAWRRNTVPNKTQ